MFGNFIEKFLSNGTGIFLGIEKRNRIELYHLQNTGKFFTFSRHEELPLVIQTNGTENFGYFGKNRKRKYLERYYFFPENFHLYEPFHLNSP